MKLDKVDTTGKIIEAIELSESIYATKVNKALLAQYLHVHKQRRALGTKKTKSQGEVRGGGAKPWRQKGTGRARHGSSRSTLWVGGAHAHAIVPRPDNRIRVTKKMRNLALVSALSYKFNEGTVTLLNELVLSKPRTKDLLQVLTDLKIADVKVLVVMPLKNEAVEKSAANLPMVEVTEARLLNPIQVLNHKKIVLVDNSLDIISERIGA